MIVVSRVDLTQITSGINTGHAEGRRGNLSTAVPRRMLRRLTSMPKTKVSLISKDTFDIYCYYILLIQGRLL